MQQQKGEKVQYKVTFISFFYWAGEEGDSVHVQKEGSCKRHRNKFIPRAADTNKDIK